MAAGGERNIESNQFAIDVSCFTLSQRYKNELSATSNLGRRFLPASVSIDILSLRIYDSGFQKLDTEFKVLNTGFYKLDSEFKKLDS